MCAVSESDAHQLLPPAAVLPPSGRSADPDKRHAAVSRGWKQPHASRVQHTGEPDVGSQGERDGYVFLF